MARPSKYDKINTPKLAYAMALAGRTDDQIAEFIGVNRDTLYDWKKKYPEFSDALKNGKEEPDDKVERALFARATGYSYKAEKPMSISDGNGMGSHIETIEYTEHLAPDVTAQIFWLKNRRPDRWREKQELSISGELSTPVPFVFVDPPAKDASPL